MPSGTMIISDFFGWPSISRMAAETSTMPGVAVETFVMGEAERLLFLHFLAVLVLLHNAAPSRKA